MSMFFFFNDPATTKIYTYLHTLSLHDALPILVFAAGIAPWQRRSRKENEQVAACLRAGAAAAEELNLLIDGAEGYAIYMLDPEGRVTIWNEGAERLQGWTEAEIGRAAWRERVCQYV